MRNLKEKIQTAAKEIQRSLLMTVKDKKYWLAQLPTLPDFAIDSLLKSLEGKNKTIDQYMSAALAGDNGHQYLNQFKSKKEKILQRAFQIEEKAEGETAEEQLKKQIENI